MKNWHKKGLYPQGECSFEYQGECSFENKDNEDVKARGGVGGSMCVEGFQLRMQADVAVLLDDWAAAGTATDKLAYPTGECFVDDDGDGYMEERSELRAVSGSFALPLDFYEGMSMKEIKMHNKVVQALLDEQRRTIKKDELDDDERALLDGFERDVLSKIEDYDSGDGRFERDAFGEGISDEEFQSHVKAFEGIRKRMQEIGTDTITEVENDPKVVRELVMRAEARSVFLERFKWKHERPIREFIGRKISFVGDLVGRFLLWVISFFEKDDPITLEEMMDELESMRKKDGSGDKDGD